MTQPLDLIILGGGPAGMSAALVAGRARLQTLVLNAESPRNQVTRASHGFLTRDGAHADELLAVAKEQLKTYPAVRYLRGLAEGVTRAEGGFEVRAASGERWVTRRLIIATGYRDELSRLSLPGVEAVYGTSAFPCPFCDGFEHRDERIAVFATESAPFFTPVVRVWSDDVAVFTNGGALAAEAIAALEQRGVPVHTQAVAELVSEDGVLQEVVLVDGQRVARDVAFIAEDYSSPATPFALELGVPETDNDWGMRVLDADEHGKTAVPGLYVIGDARSGFGGLIGAANEGSSCVSHIVHEVAQERWG